MFKNQNQVSISFSSSDKKYIDLDMYDTMTLIQTLTYPLVRGGFWEVIVNFLIIKLYI